MTPIEARITETLIRVRAAREHAEHTGLDTDIMVERRLSTLLDRQLDQWKAASYATTWTGQRRQTISKGTRTGEAH